MFQVQQHTYIPQRHSFAKGDGRKGAYPAQNHRCTIWPHGAVPTRQFKEGCWARWCLSTVKQKGAQKVKLKFCEKGGFYCRNFFRFSSLHYRDRHDLPRSRGNGVLLAARLSQGHEMTQNYMWQRVSTSITSLLGQTLSHFM